ncbi:cell division protein ZapA [Parvularcula flava]|uniref:Cell division protein ZapA n=1 Tax=Aquisalinus luteolus TaxID=1566827 RepID=A0A8J3EVP4_9PROT|nr:cell division protein ZapA [Aquisalinus luteolus]NHK29283.1 cell division protein ZapA [Aquisalinus luteolus]GGI01247.1 cell division protein ZapA [Aquisalinus luteolus]
MGQVTISINGQNYNVTCDDGQEDRLKELANYFDGHVSRLAAQIGNIADSRLMLLAGLTVCDELKEAQLLIRDLEDESGLTSEKGAAEIIKSVTDRVHEIAERLEEPSTSA